MVGTAVVLAGLCESLSHIEELWNYGSIIRSITDQIAQV